MPGSGSEARLDERRFASDNQYVAEVILINRAPVLALWAAVVAERLGFSRDEALSLGKAVTGLNAQAKGTASRIYKKHEIPRERREGRADSVELFGREIPVTRTADGVRALAKGEPFRQGALKRTLSPSSANTWRWCARRWKNWPGR